MFTLTAVTPHVDGKNKKLSLEESVTCVLVLVSAQSVMF